MKFHWNAEKARTNLAKHGIDFELAKEVWRDPLHAIIFDRVVDGEERWWAVGTVRSVLVVVVVHAYSGGGEGSDIRIIGARRATPGERRQYEEEAD